MVKLRNSLFNCFPSLIRSFGGFFKANEPLFHETQTTYLSIHTHRTEKQTLMFNEADAITLIGNFEGAMRRLSNCNYSSLQWFYQCCKLQVIQFWKLHTKVIYWRNTHRDMLITKTFSIHINKSILLIVAKTLFTKP